MIHAYFTEGMLDNAEVFLKSLFKTNGDRWPVLLTTRDLNSCQIKRLHELYPVLEVQNKKLNMEKLADRAKVPVETLWKYRRQAEVQHITPENKVWKLMIAAEDRPRALYKILRRRRKSDPPIMHFDIDTLFRDNLYRLFTLGMMFDCCLLLRPNIRPVKARITISTMTWQNNEITRKFFDRWLYWLEFCPPPRRPVGYGQTSCWYAFEELHEDLLYHRLSPEWGYPGNNKKSHVIWSGAVNKLKKKDCAVQFREEMERLK